MKNNNPNTDSDSHGIDANCSNNNCRNALDQW